MLHNDAPGEQQLFDIAIAETEAEVQLDAMADDRNWEAVVLVPISRWCAHGVSIAHQVSIGQAAQQVDNAYGHHGSDR
jgi:phage tail sheath protein FI